MWFILTLAWSLTQALHDLQVPDLGETISSHSRVSNHEESPQTIILQHPRYQSRTVEISSEIIAINGNVQSRPTILESQQVKGTLLHVTNSTASFANLAFKPLTTRILTAIDHSECLVSNSVISVIEGVSPFECSDSLVQVVDSEFDFISTQNRSPSLSTTASLSSSVTFRSCSFSDVVVSSPGSLICCSSVQTSQTDHCDFRNISHCPTFLHSSFSPLFHNVSVLNSRFSDCENVLFGGVVRDTEDRTSLLAANTTFTRSRSTYTNRTGASIGPTSKTAEVVTVDHRYQQCTFTQCVSADAHGGGIRCETGANLAVDNCTFIKCRSYRKSITSGTGGGGIYMSGENVGGGASVTRCVFSDCEAIYGGGMRLIRPSDLVVQFCNLSECYVVDVGPTPLVGCWGGGIGLTGMPLASVLSNVRFEDSESTLTGAHLDNNHASGSITYSNLLFARGECKQGNVIFSHVNGDPEIAFFSCTFFSNVASDTRSGTVNGTTKAMAIGNDIRFYHLPVWERILKSKSSFVNCFSTSDFPRIALDKTPLVVDFSAFTGGNNTLLDIHLPTPGIVVSAETGRDGDGCGSTGSDSKCQSIGFTGENRLADADTTVLVEGGRYEETISFDVGRKPAFFSSNGDEYPIVSFSPPSDEDSFMALGVGKLSLSLFTFVPCETASIVKVVGAGTLTIESCQFQNEDGLTPMVEANIISMREGTAHLQKVEFVGISFNQGRIVKCSGDVTKLEIQECVFSGMSGIAGPLISFERLSEGGEFIINKAQLHGIDVSDGIGGITTNNVQTVTITSTTFAHLTDQSQKAAISIGSCTASLTLSDLVFEDCSGSEASSLFVASSVTLTNPIPNSISTTDSPISSVNGDTTTIFIPKPNTLTVDRSLGSGGVFCWKESTGCVSLSSLEPRIGKGHTWPISAAAGTSLESSVTLEDKTLLVSGSGKSSTTFQHFGGIDSPLFVQTSGSLTVSGVHFSILPAQSTTPRSSSFFSISGGSISLTSVSFISISFSSSNSLVTLTGAASITLDTIDFSGMTTEGSGSVLHSTSTGTIALSSVSFSSCNCGSSQKGRSVFIERSFVADCVSMTSVQISSAGTVGSHDIFLKGSNIASTVAQNWESLIGAENTLTSAVMNQIVGEEEGSLVKSGPLAYMRYPHTEGSMHVDGHYWDHENCGKEKLPCKSFEFVHLKLNTSNQKVVFLSAYSLSGEINSLALGSVLSTKLTQTVSTDQTTQFVVQAGPLSFEAINILLPTAITKPLFVVQASVLTIASSLSIQNAPSASTHQAPLFSLSSGTLQMTGTEVIFQPIFASTKSLIEQTKGSLTISNLKIENVTRTSGDGSVISATLSANTDKLLIESTTFTSCSCSGGNGGALFVSLSASAVFSITGTSSFTSCTASGKGSKLYLSRPDLVSFLTPNEGTGPLDSIKPTLSTKAAADGILNEFYGFESPSSEGSLLFYWYPFSALDTTMHVHSSGHTHSLCGKEALPCKTLPDSLNKIQSASTLMIDTNIDLSTKLTSLPRAWTLTKSGSSVLTFVASGQLELSNSGSALTLSSLSLEVGILAVDRTAELIAVSAGSLVVSSCTVFSSTSNLPVSFVALSSGGVSITSTSLNIKTIQSKPVLSITGGELKTDSSTTLVNSGTASHQASLVSLEGGKIVLDGSKLTTTQKLTLASSALMTQSKGSLTISNMKIENVSRTTGDGSVISATLSANTDVLSIVSTTFTLCSCSGGNGGALFVSLSASAVFSITGTSSFTSCTASGKGSKLYLSRTSLVSFLTPNEGTGPLDSIKPILTTKAAADAILKEFYGFESSSSEGSLLFYWYPFSTLDTTMHVHSSGHAHSLCGKEALPCKTLPDSLNKIQSASTLMIDTNIDLSTKLTSLPRAWTLTKSGSSVLTFVASGQLELSNSGSALTLSSLSLEVGILAVDRTAELIAVSAGSLVVSSCTVFSSTSNLPVSFVALSSGGVSITSTSLNIKTIQSKPVLSITGGELKTDSSTTLVNSGTASHQASLVSLEGGKIVLDGSKLTTTQKLTLASSALMTQSKGSLTISNMKIENVSRTTGDGSVISATLSANTDVLSIVSTTFTLCSCSGGNGGALFVSLSASAVFSITGTSSFTSCTASGKGSKLYLSRTSLVSFLTPNEGTGPLDSIKPILTTKAAADAILKEFYGFESSSSEGSLLFYWYPFSTLDTTMHVHSSGHAHSLCGKEALPCKTLPDSLSKIQSADTLMIDTNIDLSTKLTSLPRAWTLTKSGSSALSIITSGQLELSNSGSALTLSSLSVDVGPLTAGRTAELVTVSAGSLVLSSCNVFSSTSNLLVSFVALSGGIVSITSTTLNLPTIQSKPVISVSGGTLNVASSASFVNLDTATHQASLLSVSDGTVALDGASLTTSKSMTFASSSLIVQKKGSLTLKDMVVENMTRQTGDGSVISATLATGTDKLSIFSTTFASCSCSSGNGGALAVSLSASALFSITGTSSFTSCTASGKGSKLYLSRPDILSFVSTGNLDSIKPALTTKTAADGILNEFYGFESPSSEGSLLFYWYPFSALDTTMHVHSSGHAHSLCGKEALPCQTLPDSLSKIQSADTLMIDTNIELPSKLTSLACEWTLSSSGSFTVTVTSEGQIEVKDNQSNLTVSSLSLDVGTLTSKRTTELMTVSAGLLVLSSCTVFASTPSLSVSFVLLSNGKVSFPDSTMNIPTLTSKPFVSVSGGKLEVDSSTSFVNSNTATHQASLVSMKGGEVVLDGTSLLTSQSMTFASSPLIIQTKGSLTLKNMVIENITRQTGDGSVLHSTLSSPSDKVQISGTSSFKDCHSTAGNGGVIFISCPQSFPSSSLVVDATFSDCSCGPDKKGEWVFVNGHAFKSLLSPAFWTKTIGGLTWDSPNSLWGTDTNETESSVYRSISLLYHLLPYQQHTIHVGTGGRNENGCGSSTWKCLTLNQARAQLSGSIPYTLSIDNEASHSDGLAISSETTIKGDPATSKLLVGAAGSLSVSASTLSLSTLVLDGSSVSRQSSLLTLSQTGSLDINHCSFIGFKSTTDGAVFSSALGAGNSVTIANTAFTSCTSDGNGGALAITLNGGSLTIADTNVTFSSCVGLKGKNVYLAGQDLTTTLATGGLNGIKPSTPENGIFGDDEKSKWFGNNTGSDGSSGSLLYYWYPHLDTATSTHVHSSGVDHPLCGVQALPCLKLSHALTNTNSADKFILDSKHSLNEAITIANAATITSNTAGLAVNVQRDGCFSITASTLSVESLSFTTTVSSFDRSLFTITTTGSLALKGSNFTGFSSTVAGSIVSGTVSNSVLIEQCTLSKCNSTEIGGIVSVSLTGSGTISISDNTFTSCTSSKNEGNLGSISSPDLIAFLKTNTLSSIKPLLPTNNGLFGNEEKSKWFGLDAAKSTTGSLLYYWYPHLDTEATTHVHSNGETHQLCGLTALPCSTLSFAVQKTTTEKKTIIDSAFLLNESLSSVFGAHTLTSTSPLNTVTIGGEATIALTANSLTLQSISFTQSTQVQALAHPLVSVTSAPITIDHCTFSKFTLADSALIAHTGSNLSLSGGSFKGITRRQGEGAVLASIFDDHMELHVDDVTLDNVASETGLADGLHISFLALTHPTHSTPFSLTNLVFTQSSSSNTDSSHFVTIVGNDFSTWIATEDLRFAGSYESLPSDSWLWSVDEETELNGSVVFYLKEGSGPVGVSDAGYVISKCGFFSVWCGKLEYGLAVADTKHQVQINIHDTVTVDTLIDLNEEYRIHGKLSSSVIVLTQMGGFVIDSGEEVIFDGMTLKITGNADRSTLEVLDGHFHLKNARLLTNTAATLPFIRCQDSQLTLESVVMDKLNSTDGKTVGALVSMTGGTFSLVNFELRSVDLTSTPFVFSEVASCSLTNLTASELPSTELIQIDSSDSFTLQSCLFSGVSNPSSQLNEDNLCSWSTGLISINSTPTTIRGSEFTSLGQGALNVNGSRVSVATSEFMINSAGSSDFPSVHRNIRCSDGNVTFVDLSDGDGVNNTSLWISGENCEVRVKEEKIISPFFQPAFDAEKSSTKQQKNKTLTITLVAGLLVPCGLQLELYESSKESDHKSSFLKPLTQSTTTSFTEQQVILSLSPTEVTSKLNESAEWKGRIITGDEQRSSSFVVKRSLSDERKSQAIQAMKWVIPVVCASLALLFIIILLIVLCRRRRQKKATEKKDKEELNDVQDEKIEVLDDRMLYPASSLVNAVPSQAPFDKEDSSVKKTAINQERRSFHQDTQSYTSVDVVKAEHGVQVAQMNKRDTLYNRLHSNQRQPISKGITAQQIIRALMKLYNVNSTLELFTRFSSHVVLFDADGQVYLDMNSSNPNLSAVPLVQGHPIVQAQPATDSNMTQTAPLNQREGFEMMRWRAPETVVEQGEEKKEVKPDQAAVFSLGLVLYEIETGLVPFGEMDAVNASRQLRTGCLPKMELVGSEELSTLIAECLSLDGKYRPKLDSLESRIASISFKIDDVPNLLEFA
ncbi:hypothetical protein BLNAU_22265 [Blattamonas nauphoetae]|uniref:Protein kinase domain-containing protein n=1 Tax=Blattamonas nauphoetae TaxID=2049346 RepID=A0ABQ9WTJ3_9EUKA|nr:hypothetical protein BLNAU_22265 [Blattamonas nauphoetae]